MLPCTFASYKDVHVDVLSVHAGMLACHGYDGLHMLAHTAACARFSCERLGKKNTSHRKHVSLFIGSQQRRAKK
jgi:hypothetical protein